MHLSLLSMLYNLRPTSLCVGTCRFGTASTTQASEELKRKARAERFFSLLIVLTSESPI